MVPLDPEWHNLLKVLYSSSDLLPQHITRFLNSVELRVRRPGGVLISVKERSLMPPSACCSNVWVDRAADDYLIIWLMVDTFR